MHVIETAALFTLLGILGPRAAGPIGPLTLAVLQPAAAEEERWEFRWTPGPSLRLGDRTRIDFHARVQLDAVSSPAAGGGDHGGVDVARRRIGIEGQLGAALQFEIEREIGSARPWRDAYVNYRPFEALRVQGGRFKLPFGLDENVGAANLDFVQRSRAATLLAPGRDRGIVIHGRPFTRIVRYETGVFEHDGQNARGPDAERVSGGTTRVGRITVQPFAGRESVLADLRVGVAFTDSPLSEGFSALRGRTALDTSFFRADVWVKGRRRRAGAELRWRPGPASLQAEYIRLTDERRGQSVEDTDLSPLVATGWYVHGTWMITGERKASGADRPRRPLLRKGGAGAIELAARLEAVSFGSAAGGEPPSTSPRADVIAGSTLHGATFGVNWYLNRWMKLQANVIRERIAEVANEPSPEGRASWSSLLRAQFAF